ncbi:MAG: class I SAM-dependent methyltransferase [Calditrichaeota bacterium]|nr:MAG: class I SAM-dependent methyltransferase [Calditrichota bacterium]
MRSISKVCDAADWFDPEVLRIIHQELEEAPRFHRKQWEFAMIYLALQTYGMLQPHSVGLSMGGGTERVLYSIARRIHKLTVTDLYEENTDWDCARFPNADEYLKAHKPFQVEEERFEALHMDMRHLEFPDNTFDFCYSSCAVEHIGEYPDFLQHLQEVHRVLKPGGIYAFTTEFHFGEPTIQDAHNFLFSGEYLRRLIAESPLALVAQPDVEVTPHVANYPFPGNFPQLCFMGETHMTQSVFDFAHFPHLMLLRGKYPFTSILLILKKEAPHFPGNRLEFPGLEASQHFLAQGIEAYRRRLQENILSIHPYSFSGRTRFFADHQEFFDPVTEPPKDDTVFHTDYFWLADGERHFYLRLVPAEDIQEPASLTLRIQRYATLLSGNVECVLEQPVEVRGKSPITLHFTLPVDEDYCYALVGKWRQGPMRLHNIEIYSSPYPLAETPNPGNEAIAQHQERTSSWDNLWTLFRGALPGSTPKVNSN